MNKTKEADMEKALRTLLGAEIEQLAGMGNGDVLHDSVLLLAARDKMEPYAWLLMKIVGLERPYKAKTAGKKGGYKNVEAPGDSEITDEQIISLLRFSPNSDTNIDDGVRSRDWAKAASSALGLSNGGFYTRLDKLVESGSVLVDVTMEPGMLYGRDIMMKVKRYWLPSNLEEYKGKFPEVYERVTGKKVPEIV